MNYRAVTDMATLEKVVDLEITVWGIDSRDAVPSSILHAIVENGGVLLIAEDDDQIIGLCLGLAARRERESYLWSHMTGIHPDYQDQGIGYSLKLAQREWALEHGYTKIRWTFDPIQRGNANFNIHLLKATSNTYHVNYYGEMTDGINAGLPSDRLEAVWLLKDNRRAAEHVIPDAGIPDTSFLTCADSDGRPQQNELAFQQPLLYMEIPVDIADLKRANAEMALAWRLAIRESMQRAFAQGYAVIDFIRTGDRYAYVLASPPPWFMYIAECNDGTLYTGIALDVARRIRQHNAGKGAAYTATRVPISLLGAWQFPDQSSALKAEASFKRKSRAQKLSLMSSRLAFRNGAFVNAEE